MTTITSSSIELNSYRDQHFKGSRGEQERLLRTSSTLYVGKLSFYTTEEEINDVLSNCYRDSFTFLPYYSQSDADSAMRYINGTRLGDSIIRTDWDAGFAEGQQCGRGKTGKRLIQNLL
jgi:nuclear cap-binding protein subunit 2